jgi:polar amino acid transport system substrate-binding protein
MLRLSNRSALLSLAISLSVIAPACSSDKTADTTAVVETTAVVSTETTAVVAAETSAAATETSAATSAAIEVPDAVKSKGSISFAMDASYPPFESFDTDNKTIIGFDADLSDAIAAKLGVKAEHVNAGFDSILVGLAASKFDIGMSAFSVTPERAKSVDFVVYLSGGSGIDVQTGNPMKLSMDPKSLCGHKISAQKGSVQALDYLPKFSSDCVAAGSGKIDIQLYPSQTDANLAVTSGRADAVMGDSVSMAAQAKGSNGLLELAPGDDYDPSQIGLATVKGSPLVEATSQALAQLKEDGTVAKLLAKWDIPPTAATGAEIGKIVK